MHLKLTLAQDLSDHRVRSGYSCAAFAGLAQRFGWSSLVAQIEDEANRGVLVV